VNGLTPVHTRITLDNISLTAWGRDLGVVTTEGNVQMPVPNFPMYLWTVFFTVDGSTAQLVLSGGKLSLQGSASVIGTAGNQGDLPANGNSNPVPNVVSIPASLGTFPTVLKPIALDGTPLAPGVVGCVAILLAQCGTPADAVSQGHDALNSSLQQQLNNLIPTLSGQNQTITPTDVQNIENQVGKAVTNAIKNALSLWDDILTVLGDQNQDFEIGAAAYFTSASDIASGPGSVAVTNGYPNSVSIALTGALDTPGLNLAGYQWNGATLEEIDFVINGTIAGDPVPLSLGRILNRLGTDSVRQAMAVTATQYPDKFPASAVRWADRSM
jgi:hypothetical protein